MSVIQKYIESISFQLNNIHFKANIVLSASKRPLLTDFGLSRQTISSVSGWVTTSDALAGSLSWMAPEFFLDMGLDIPIMKANLKTDVWAYGMTVLVSMLPLLSFL